MSAIAKPLWIVMNFLIGQEHFFFARETGVWSQVESYQRLKKMVLDSSLLNTKHYKVRIKGKLEQYREMSCTLHYTSV